MDKWNGLERGQAILPLLVPVTVHYRPVPDCFLMGSVPATQGFNMPHLNLWYCPMRSLPAGMDRNLKIWGLARSF